MSEKKAAWFRVPASAAGAEVKDPGLWTEQENKKGHTMKAYHIIHAAHVVAVLFAMDAADALAKAAAAGIPATNAIRVE